MERTVIGIDGDDTLWHSENHFVTTTDRLMDLLMPWVHDTDGAAARLIEIERHNLDVLGYGVKAFTLSMIETAIDISSGEVPASAISQIIEWCKEMMDHPVELLDGVQNTLPELARRYELILITKGDLLHQESKVARSELESHFRGVEIVSEKDPPTYRRILERYVVDPSNFVMVGNSLRSDILPVLEIGGAGVHVPYHVTWALEQVHDDDLPSDVVRIETFADLQATLDEIV